MLIRFRAVINIIGEMRADVWPILPLLRFDLGGVFFARIAFPEKWRVRRALRPNPDAFPVEVCPDLLRPCHGLGREGLIGLVNQS